MKSTAWLLQNIPVIIGYARVSTIDQNGNSQLDGLKAAGWEKPVSDQVSDASVERRKLDKLLSGLQVGDVLLTANRRILGG